MIFQIGERFLTQVCEDILSEFPHEPLRHSEPFLRLTNNIVLFFVIFINRNKNLTTLLIFTRESSILL
jgi:hypothetical protein